jgi:tRNA pseudouridine55 synthase
VRVLAEDIGRSLGCGAHLIALRRTRTGGFDIGGAVTIERLEEMTLEQRDALLLPPDCLVAGLPAVDLDADSAFYFRRGQEVWKPRQIFSGEVRVYDEQHRFVGIGEITSEGRVAPKRLVAAG